MAIALCVCSQSVLARAGGQWFELPPEFFSQPAEKVLLTPTTSLHLQHTLELGYLEYLSTSQLENGPTIQRITNNGSSEPHGLHRYSRQQVWNADESIIDIGDRLLDAKTFEVVNDGFDLSTARNWSHTKPNIFYGIRYVGGQANILVSYNVVSNVYFEIYSFKNHQKCTFGAGEGNVSNDERYVLISCNRRDNGQVELLSIDMQKGVLLGSKSASDGYNWASFSPSGQFILVENQATETGTKTELVRFAPDFTNKQVLSNSRNHGDLGLDEHGDDVFVMIDWDYISYIRLKDGLRVNLSVSSPTSTPAGHGHISCRNIRRPGWCYFSSYERGLVGAVRIAQNPTASKYIDNDQLAVGVGVAEVELWGYHHSNSSNYRAQPKVTVSPTGTQLIFSSDWYDSAATDDYLLSVAQ